jgi:hypothetical protein
MAKRLLPLEYLEGRVRGAFVEPGVREEDLDHVSQGAKYAYDLVVVLQETPDRDANAYIRLALLKDPPAPLVGGFVHALKQLGKYSLWTAYLDDQRKRLTEPPSNNL